MFWKGRVSFLQQMKALFAKHDLAIASDIRAPPQPVDIQGTFRVAVANLSDVAGIVKLLNHHFEYENSKSKVAVTEDWLRSTFQRDGAIWFVAKDLLGTIRGCISSFHTVSPFPNSLAGWSSNATQWSLVDWYCVEPLWRGTGVGTTLLEVLDFVTYKMGRKAHVFLKEGLPLPLPHIPFYMTYLRCRLAGNPSVSRMREGTGLGVHVYQMVDKETGEPLIRVEGIRDPQTATKEAIKEWEDALDKELPRCRVFVSGADIVDQGRGWQYDSLVSVYAFRWLPGKWFGSAPNAEIL